MNETNKFETYLLSEYSNISQAHFKSIETISTFFRHYLLIMSIPLSAIAIFSRFYLHTQQTLNIFQEYKLPISGVLFCVSLAGFWVFCYITNLRLDTLLYARTVNGIRKYFYDESDIDINFKLRMRALPQSPQLPLYYEKSYFLPVVFVFAIINTLYLSFASCIFFKNYCCLLLIIPVSLVAHGASYWGYAYHREHKYLKSNILGVDIDGVLNKHREHFCSLLYEKTGKKIKPEEITVVPVHEHPSLGVIRADERKVFNDPAYWKKMPIIDGAADNLRRLHNTFKLKIHIFTYRPWPDAKGELWKSIKNFLDECENCPVKYVLRLLYVARIIKPLLKLLKEEPLKQITKEWLKRHNFKYKRFVFEKGNDYSSDPRGRFNNRFYRARKEQIRYFVEDDLEKAIKLSYICDVVFLFDQPYNRTEDKIPSNIFRVESWDEIYKNIRKIS